MIITWLSVACGVFLYVFAGFRLLAPRWVVSEMERQFRMYPSLAGDVAEVESWRKTAAYEALAVALAWPVFLAVRVLAGKIGQWAPLTDREAEQKIAQRDMRIAELERQLGLGER